MAIICALLSIIILLIAGIYFAYQSFQSLSLDNFKVSVNSDKIIFETDEKFLSVALDSSFMGCMFHQLNEGPGESDRFIKNNNCTDIHSNETIIITGKDWIKINEFANNSGFNLIADLNVLLRSNSEWNSSNAKSLINFSEQNGFQLDFQLGNEPNSFLNVFNVNLSGAELARDFFSLRRILNSTKAYRKSKLIGPDVTRPRDLGENSLNYLREFLKKEDVVDVVSWHQYYLNGRTATLEDFIDPKTFDFFPPQVESVTKTVREFSSTAPIWLSETSTAYGGGAPKLSNRFAASFLWVDKLGIAARSGISVVIRQTLFLKYYALITEKFNPTPDFWISLLYKKLVGARVLDLHTEKESRDLRLYAHCLAFHSGVNGSVVIYGLNLKNQSVEIYVEGLSITPPVKAYIFQPELSNLRAKSVLLNDNLLVYNATEKPNLANMSVEADLPLVFPYQSIGFWVFQAEGTACDSH